MERSSVVKILSLVSLVDATVVGHLLLQENHGLSSHNFCVTMKYP